MGLSDEIKKINAEIDELRKELGSEPLKPFKEGDIEAARLALGGLRTEIREMSSDLDYVSRSFKDSVNELSRQNTYLTDARNSLRGIASISDKVLQYRKGEISLSEKELKNLRQQAKAKFNSLKNDINSGELRGKNLKEAEDALKKQELFNKELELTADIQRKVNKEIGLLGTGIEGVSKLLSKMGFGDLSKPLQDAIDKTKNARVQIELNKATQSELNELILLQGKNIDDLSQEELERLFALEEKYSTNVDKNKQLLQSSKDINKELESQISKYKNIGEALKDQLTSVNLLDYAYKFFKEYFTISQKGIGDLAKGLGMSASRATVMRQEFADIANTSMNANLSVKALQESQLAIGQALGTNAMLNEKDLETMTDLVKKTGLQHSELIGIEKLSLATGKSLDDNVEAALGGATAFASQNKLVVDNNKVLREVNKASDALKLSLGGSVEALGEAVVKAQKFGINLEQAERIASSMLDFESSIEAELSAELLTGKNLNLERARQLALEGDIASAAEEVLKQLEGSEEFSKMNVIQQEAMAKAVGLTRDQLASSLIEREALAAMSAEEGETALQAYNKLKDSGKTEKEIVDILGEKAAQQLEQQSAQEKFNNAVEKLKEIFVQVMDALAPIFDVLASIAEVVLPAINFILQPLITAFQGIGKIVTGSYEDLEGWEAILGSIALVAIGYYSTMKLIKGVQIAIRAQKIATIAAQRSGLAVEAASGAKSKVNAVTGIISGAWKSLGPIPFIGAALAIGAIASGIAYLYSQSSKAEKKGNDIMSPGQGSSGYGKRTLFGPEGAIQLNNKDTVIAGTNLFGNDIKSEPGKITEMAKEGEIKVNPSPSKGTYQDDPNDTVIMGTGIDKGKEKPTSQSPNGGSSNVKIDMTQTNALLQRIIETNTQLINVIQTGGDVMLDGQKVGTALKLGSFKTQ